MTCWEIHKGDAYVDFRFNSANYRAERPVRIRHNQVMDLSWPVREYDLNLNNHVTSYDWKMCKWNHISMTCKFHFPITQQILNVISWIYSNIILKIEKLLWHKDHTCTDLFKKTSYISKECIAIYILRYDWVNLAL